jgi:hypothetical protein
MAQHACSLRWILSAVALALLPALPASAQLKKAPTYTISGQASSGALLQLYGPNQARSTTTIGKTANYLFAGVAPGTYTVRPAQDNCTFTPAERIVSVTDSNISGVDFTATCHPLRPEPGKKQRGRAHQQPAS